MTSISGIISSKAETYEAVELSDNGLGYLYFFDNGTDPSGFVFELADLDVSGSINVDPSFAQALESLAGLPDCDATLEFDASLSAFQGLFSFQTDSSDVNDVSAEDVRFRVNKPSDDTFNDISSGTGSLNVGTFFNALTFSDAVVKSGKVNASYPNQQVKFDFVRHLAKEITGGYSSSDIFTNETALVNAVVALDSTLGNSFNTDISTASSGQASDFLSFTTNSTNSYIRAAYGLYNVNLQTTDGSGGDGNVSRSDQLLTDISNASANFSGSDGAGGNTTRPLNIPLRFSSGDRLAVRVVYKPNGAFAGNGVTPSERSYKVLFRLT